VKKLDNTIEAVLPVHR